MGDLGSIPGLVISPGEENSYPLQYSGLERNIPCSPWGMEFHVVPGVAKSRTQLSDFHVLSLSGNTTKVILIYQLLESGYDIDFNIVEK